MSIVYINNELFCIDQFHGNKPIPQLEGAKCYKGINQVLYILNDIIYVDGIENEVGYYPGIKHVFLLNDNIHRDIYYIVFEHSYLVLTLYKFYDTTYRFYDTAYRVNSITNKYNIGNIVKHSPWILTYYYSLPILDRNYKYSWLETNNTIVYITDENIVYRDFLYESRPLLYKRYKIHKVDNYVIFKVGKKIVIRYNDEFTIIKVNTRRIDDIVYIDHSDTTILITYRNSVKMCANRYTCNGELQNVPSSAELYQNNTRQLKSARNV